MKKSDKSKKQKIKAVIFDVGGVLALGKNPPTSTKKIKGHLNIGVHQFISNKLNISVDQWFDSIDKDYVLSVEGKISELKLMNSLSKKTNIPKRKLKQIIIQGYRENFKQNKQLFEHAFELKKNGYKIAILSDQWYLSQEALMPKKIYKNFNPVIVSCDAGVRKPNPEIYRLTLRKLGVKPFESLFIDNQTWNIKPAKALGIKAILFKSNKQLFKHPIWRSL